MRKWDHKTDRLRMALQSAEALEWRADYLEAQAQEARAAASAARRSNGLPAAPAPPRNDPNARYVTNRTLRLALIR